MPDTADRDAILRERAEILARVKPPPDASGTDAAVLTCRVGQGVYAIDPSIATEVLPMRNVARLPGGTEWILGVINVHGRLVPIFDLGRTLGLPSQGTITKGVVIVAAAESEEIGLRVDAVEGMREVAVRDMTPAPPTGSACLKGIMPDGLFLLDTPALFAAITTNRSQSE